MRIWIPLALLALTTCIPSVVSAQIAYDEITSGDLGDPIDGAPTNLGVLGPGVNTVFGTLENAFNPVTFLDRDSFTFTVADGLQLDSLLFTSLDGGSRFYALSNRDSALSTTDPSGNYYTSLVGANSIGVNLLDGTVNNYGSPGGSGPLAAGDYSFWLQETDFTTPSYSLSLTTSAAVPEPGSTFALLCGGGVLLLRRRRTLA
jgi:hypothetical protein